MMDRCFRRAAITDDRGRWEYFTNIHKYRDEYISSFDQKISLIVLYVRSDLVSKIDRNVANSRQML